MESEGRYTLEGIKTLPFPVFSQFGGEIECGLARLLSLEHQRAPDAMRR